MTDPLTAALEYARSNQGSTLVELKEFVGIPSISTDPESSGDVQRAAEWVANKLADLGMGNIQIFPTAKHPVVYGESLAAGAGAPTVLVYGHYDVQPAEPLELWHSPAFEPTLRGENLYGRGTSDMKGQIVASLKAVEAYVRTGQLPVNIKFIIEGEEEIGSPNLGAFIEEHQQLLACDLALNPDSGMLGAENPTITYGLRGLAYFDLHISGPSQDLHSGLFGGTVHNPAIVLCDLIAGMHDESGRITLPGFYDSVRPLSAVERAELARLPQDENFYLEGCGAPALYGESGYSPVERASARPSLDVNGLLSGFTGEGSKTVLPAKAMAKISMRLVPDQDPDEVQRQLEQYLEDNAPDTVTWEIKSHSSAPASITDRGTAGVLALTQALEDTWGVRPVFKREGGTIPVVAQMQDILGVESVLTGFGLPDDNLHAPNEKLHLPTFYRGIEALVRFLSILGTQA
jgi:acetylornithine deacetylase/succinyl-diaminopimelate desuccinylase-like protein